MKDLEKTSQHETMMCPVDNLSVDGMSLVAHGIFVQRRRAEMNQLDNFAMGG